MIRITNVAITFYRLTRADSASVRGISTKLSRL
jgi:hypothetical protein